ncbi:GMC family oxidoreductase [Paraburkholderia silvatlantica]|uniref:GMC family oxidoreductase n=1 Tax=Paraburkholderia silvatlantica TaxID=321895 RepID=UPI000D5F0C11|nr:GMC family oxidoreductase N-terminal domain-containing protein [Paraburkholderia silvatlantica]PVY23324.1 choline dehydrogenase-like flavoprotein [Paraburkholderia silvatlantica]PXW29883.1 choline dehydrogenase-like flavoprotein [Paraburkholderia silvatlantica]
MPTRGFHRSLGTGKSLSFSNRLGADPAVKVCLVEAGPGDRRSVVRQLVNIPAGTLGLIANPRYDWMYSFDANDQAGHRDIFCPRGRVLGGSSAINGSIYIRGARSDYDRWASLGNTGWGYRDVLPYFTRHENFEGDSSPWHGVGGELNVTRLRSPHRVSNAFVAAALEAGHRFNDDFNGATQAGFGHYHVTQRHGERMSSSRSFLHPVLSRPNLTIVTDALVERILFQNRTATGIEFVHDRVKHVFNARREIVLSAGTIGSPQLLMLSGIGPAQHLSDLGIRTVHALPGVGYNLHDHQDILMAFDSPRSDLFGLSIRALPWLAASPFSYYLDRKGPWTSNTVEAGGFFKSSASQIEPDLQLIIRPLLGNQPKSRIPRGHGFSVHISLMRPASRGRLLLRSADPADKPLLQSNFLSGGDDARRLSLGIAEVRRIVSMPAMSAFRGDEIEPGKHRQSEDALSDYVHSHVATTFHPVGTCKMGTDAMAVVNPDLRVCGIDGLRVADASIMPAITSGNTNAPSIMIGEKCAALILG